MSFLFSYLQFTDHPSKTLRIAFIITLLLITRVPICSSQQIHECAQFSGWVNSAVCWWVFIECDCALHGHWGWRQERGRSVRSAELTCSFTGSGSIVSCNVAYQFSLYTDNTAVSFSCTFVTVHKLFEPKEINVKPFVATVCLCVLYPAH